MYVGAAALSQLRNRLVHATAHIYNALCTCFIYIKNEYIQISDLYTCHKHIYIYVLHKLYVYYNLVLAHTLSTVQRRSCARYTNSLDVESGHSISPIPHKHRHTHVRELFFSDTLLQQIQTQCLSQGCQRIEVLYCFFEILLYTDSDEETMYKEDIRCLYSPRVPQKIYFSESSSRRN